MPAAAIKTKPTMTPVACFQPNPCIPMSSESANAETIRSATPTTPTTIETVLRVLVDIISRRRMLDDVLCRKQFTTLTAGS